MREATKSGEITLEVKKNTIPGWMLVNDVQRSSTAKSAGSGFMRNTVNEINKFVQNDLLAERFAIRSGLLQSIDTRVKMVSLLFLMVFTGAAKSPLTIILLAFIAYMMVRLSDLDSRAYFKRVWLILPLLMLIFSLPASTSIFIQSESLFYIYRGLGKSNILPSELYISAEGILVIFRMAARVGVSFSFGYLLIMTTRWSLLTKALQSLKVPKLFVTIIDMTYRYIFVLSKVVIEMFESRFLRTVGKVDNRKNRQFLSRSIAFLFVKANYLSDEIYDAMLCRGYTGDPVSLNRFGLKRQDYMWILNIVIIILILLMGETIFG